MPQKFPIPSRPTLPGVLALVGGWWTARPQAPGDAGGDMLEVDYRHVLERLHSGVVVRRSAPRSGAEAWERLEARGLLPGGTVGEPGRHFGDEACLRCEGRAVEVTERSSEACECVTDHPRSLLFAAALAASWSTVLTAEALAREAAACFGAVLGVAAPTQVLWLSLDPYQGASKFQHGLEGTCSKALEATGYAAGLGALRSLPPDRFWSPWMLVLERGRHRHAELETRWDRLAQRGVRFEAPAGARTGQALGSYRNPYAPLVALWQTGVVPLGLLPGRILLGMPQLEPGDAPSDSP